MQLIYLYVGHLANKERCQIPWPPARWRETNGLLGRLVVVVVMTIHLLACFHSCLFHVTFPVRDVLKHTIEIWNNFYVCAHIHVILPAIHFLNYGGNERIKKCAVLVILLRKMLIWFLIVKDRTFAICNHIFDRFRIFAPYRQWELAAYK